MSLSFLKDFRDLLNETAGDLRKGDRSRPASLVAAMLFALGLSHGVLWRGWVSSAWMVAGIAVWYFGAARRKPEESPPTGLTSSTAASPGDTNQGELFQFLGQDSHGYQRLERSNVPPDIAHLERQVISKFDRWSQGGFGRGRLFYRLREGRLLLRWRDLRRIEKNKELLRFPNHKVLLYINRSRHYRISQIVLALCLLISLGPGGVSAYRLARGWQERRILRAWGLPADLSDYGSQLRELYLVCTSAELAKVEGSPRATDLQWLPRGLKSLDVKCGAIKDLKGVPPKLEHLGLSDSGVTRLEGLPASVMDLDLSGTGINALDGLQGHAIQRLDVSGIPVTNMKLLPRSITVLKLQHHDIDNLEGLPDGLVELELRATSLRSLRGLPTRLERLTLIDNELLKVDVLPPQLEKLVTDTVPAVQSVPPSLKTLVLRNVTLGLVPEGISGLELEGSLIGDWSDQSQNFRERLESLRLHDTLFLLPWEMLERNLRSFKVRWQEGDRLESLPEHLVELDLSDSTGLTSVEGLGKVSILNISSTLVPDLRGIPNSVKTLRFQSCTANGLSEFPDQLATLDLAGCTHLEVLERLPDSLTELNVSKTGLSILEKLPKQLRRLDISNSAISGSLPDLQPSLEQLTLHAGQIDTLRGLPKSVWKIRFVDREQEK